MSQRSLELIGSPSMATAFVLPSSAPSPISPTTPNVTSFVSVLQKRKSQNRSRLVLGCYLPGTENGNGALSLNGKIAQKPFAFNIYPLVFCHFLDGQIIPRQFCSKHKKQQGKKQQVQPLFATLLRPSLTDHLPSCSTCSHIPILSLTHLPPGQVPRLTC